MAMPVAQLKRRSRIRRSPFGRKAPSVTSKESWRLTENSPFAGPSTTAAKRLPFLSTLFSAMITVLPMSGLSAGDAAIISKPPFARNSFFGIRNGMDFFGPDVSKPESG